MGGGPSALPLNLPCCLRLSTRPNGDIVTLVQAYYALAAALAVFGWLFLTASPLLHSFRRSRPATVILALIATAWFAWWLQNLPEADLAGMPRMPVLAVFVAASLATLFYMPDLLAIRALGVLLLFGARHVLDAGYRQLPHSLLAATISYGLLVFFGLWWASSPPAFVAQCDWLLTRPVRHRLVGGLLLLLAAACACQALLSS